MVRAGVCRDRLPLVLQLAGRGGVGVRPGFVPNWAYAIHSRIIGRRSRRQFEPVLMAGDAGYGETNAAILSISPL
jgi:hypothetical protein